MPTYFIGFTQLTSPSALGSFRLRISRFARYSPGASGAISGVLGGYLLMFPRGSVRVLMGRAIIPMPALIVIGFWALLQLVSGFGAIAATEQTVGGGVAYMAHVGGFVAGLILAPLMGGTRQPRLRAY
mgnify:CR=1 FL=1